jgi:magnesium chelatase subunit I
MAELIERIAFERAKTSARSAQRCVAAAADQRADNVLSNAERRTIVTKEKHVVPRISDVYAALPAITGKLELEYEGELQGAETIAKDLIRRAAGRTFEARVGGANVDDIVHWFDEGGALKITPDDRSEALLKGFTVVPGLLALIDQVGLAGKKDPATMVSACELILEGLVAEKRIARSEELGYVRAASRAAVRKGQPDREPGRTSRRQVTPSHPGVAMGELSSFVLLAVAFFLRLGAATVRAEARAGARRRHPPPAPRRARDRRDPRCSVRPRS